MHPSLAHFKLLCSFLQVFQYIVCFNTSLAIQYSIAKHLTRIYLLMSYSARSGLNFIQVIFPV